RCPPSCRCNRWHKRERRPRESASGGDSGTREAGRVGPARAGGELERRRERTGVGRGEFHRDRAGATGVEQRRAAVAAVRDLELSGWDDRGGDVGREAVEGGGDGKRE